MLKFSEILEKKTLKQVSTFEAEIYKWQTKSTIFCQTLKQASLHKVCLAIKKTRT